MKDELENLELLCALGVGILAAILVLLAGLASWAVGVHYHPEVIVPATLIAFAHLLPLILIVVFIRFSQTATWWLVCTLIIGAVVTIAPGLNGVLAGDFGDWILWGAYFLSSASLGCLAYLQIRTIRRSSP